MKKLLIWAMVLTSIMYVSCTKSEEGDEEKFGSIYGIVTELGTAEPMKAVGVELYKMSPYSYAYDNLLLKTVTFDDGHFEFKDLNPENYLVKVVADGYEQTEKGFVIVEAGRQARIDLQVKNNTPDYIIMGNLMIQRKDFGPLWWSDAIQICKSSTVAGYTDWRMPTIEELRIMYYNRSKIPNLKSEKYWSSLDNHPPYHSYIDFTTGKEGEHADQLYWEGCYARAVRTIE